MLGFGKSSADKMLEVLYAMPSDTPAVADSVCVPGEPIDFSESIATETIGGADITATSDFYPQGDGWGYGSHNGEKFEGETGFGGNTFLFIDYWGLRAKSAELFERNLYARGIIRRLVTNIVVTGLSLESTPSELFMGMKEGALDDWSDLTEESFELWASDPKLCDHEGRRTFGEIQREAQREALITGDILVVQRMNKRLGVPQVQLIDGSLIQTPIQHVPGDGRTIEYGVELDAARRHIAYWVMQDDGTSVRMPAFGARSGRRLAWLYYASDKRMGEVRGQPILSLILQSLKEIDRYRDSAQRKAVVNSMIALFVTKDGDGVGTRPIAAGATRRTNRVTAGEGGQGPATLKTESMNPGLAIDRLAPGESIVGHPNTGADQSYSDFEAGIVQGLAWALEIPPEILTLSFHSNYSASQAALHEFGMYLTVARTNLGQNICKMFYSEWLVSEVLAERIEAPGFLTAWRDTQGAGRYTFTAWVKSEWNGQIKPSTDMHKQMKGLQMAVNNGFYSFDKASRLATGTKWRDNIRKQRREREIAFDAKVPLSSDAGAFTDAEIAETQDVGTP